MTSLQFRWWILILPLLAGNLFCSPGELTTKAKDREARISADRKSFEFGVNEEFRFAAEGSLVQLKEVADGKYLALVRKDSQLIEVGSSGMKSLALRDEIPGQILDFTQTPNGTLFLSLNGQDLNLIYSNGKDDIHEVVTIPSLLAEGWDEYFLFYSRLFFCNNQALIFIYNQGTPVLITHELKTSRIHWYPLLAEFAEAPWHRKNVFLADNKLVIGLTGIAKEVNALRKVYDLPALAGSSYQELALIFQDGKLSYGADVRLGQRLFPGQAGLALVDLAGKELTLEDGGQREKIRISELKELSRISSAIATTDGGYLIGIQDGFKQADSGSVLSGSEAFLVYVKEGRYELFRFTSRPDRLTEIADLYPCGESYCAVLYYNLPLTHDEDRSFEAAIVRVGK